MALSRWDDDGGAGPAGPQCTSIAPVATLELAHLSQVDVVQLRVRVIPKVSRALRQMRIRQ